MMNEENESSATKANNPLTPQQDNRIFESIPVRPAPWSKTESGSPMNKERALGMFRTANQWLYDKLAEGASCNCGCCFLCAYRFFESEHAAGTPSPETPHCWHCGIELETVERRLRCDQCSADCDDEFCNAFGCAPRSLPAAPVVATGDVEGEK